MNPRFKAKHVGVDPALEPLVKEFKSLSALNNIRFYNEVTVGFAEIPYEDAIGVCHYGLFFREIDIDIRYWNHARPGERIALMFHELTHCYCGRAHDFSSKESYKNTALKRFLEEVKWTIRGGQNPGFWDDGCPTSLMYPIVIENECMLSHYNEYIKEMFDRCKPW